MNERNMESQRPFSRSKLQRRGTLARARAVESSNESSDEQSDDEVRNLGSRINLIRDKRKTAKSRKSQIEKSASKSDQEESENTIVQIESVEPQRTKPEPPVKFAPASFAQTIKRKFAFFRRSENVKEAEDVEAAPAHTTNLSEPGNRQTVDVVVDVHTEHEKQKLTVMKKRTSSKSSDESKKSSPEITIKDSLDLIEEFHEENVKKAFDKSKRNKKSSVKNFLENDSDVVSEIDANSSMDRENDELTSEILPTSGGESSRRRKRWDKAEKPADNLVEDVKKPKRKQWAKSSASAEIRKSSGQKIVVPKRLTTAEPERPIRPKSSRPSKPVAAPRSKSVKEQIIHRDFDNDGFSSDHDEVLRIETINNQSPKIKISSTSAAEKIEENISTLSEEEVKPPIIRKQSIEEIHDYVNETTESAEHSDVKDRSASETNVSSNSMEKKKDTLPLPAKRRSSSKRKFSADKRSIHDDDEEDDEDDEDIETVLNVMDKKSRKSSSSSKVEIIPSNFFEKESSDETTISTNEEMHTSRRDSRRSRSTTKSKSSSRREGSEDASARSSRTKRKTTSSSAHNSAEEQSIGKKRTTARTRKRKKKEKKKDLEDVDEEMKYISVRIHRSDMLEADYITRHPMVKVHIVNAETGDYLSIRNKDQTSGGVLQPIITAKFDFKEKKSMVPVWEEELIFEQDFKDLLAERKQSVLLLFEIVDLLTFSEANKGFDQFGKEACWYKVAWAFLRPVGTSGVRHIDKKVRLQLYRPRKSFWKTKKNLCEVYRWWKTSKRDEYPSSLYVSISAVEPPKLEPVFYEQLLQLNDLSEMRSESQPDPSTRDGQDLAEPPKWTRHAAQSCQIPNEAYLETEAADNGCFYVAFSHDGKYLACAVSEEYDYPILVYKVDEAKIHVKFRGHKNFVYTLSWSSDNRYLLSVSSDQTAQLWDVRERIMECVQSLPHPSYVYCGKFSPDSSSYLVTGCYDHVARVWARVHSRQYELVQELEGHESFVSAVAIQPKDELFITGDGLGVVIFWAAKKSRKSLVRREWQIARKIKIKETEAAAINTIVLHPLGSRLLVHSRNNSLRLMDMLSGVVLRKFEGLKNHRLQITACISPCGGLLFCGGEDSTLNVWSLDSGKLLGVYESECHEKAVTCVDYHPYDHVVAYCTYGAPLPVKILKFDREADGHTVGLKLLAMTSSMMSVSSSTRIKEHQPASVRNGVRNFEKLSARSLVNSSSNLSHSGSMNHLLTEHRNDDEARNHMKGKLQKFIDSGPNIRAKSMNRLNGIIEKIDKILMYATNQKSAPIDLESARNTSAFAMGDRQHFEQAEVFELKDVATIGYEEKRKKKSRKHRARSKSARNTDGSPSPKETEFTKAHSDSAALNRKVSRFSDDSSNSNRSVARANFVERLQLENIELGESESGMKDSLDTIVDGKEDFPSEEVLDVESLKSDDTYVVNKEKKSPGSRENDGSEKSNATFIIESEIPVPKPRRRPGKVEVV